MGSAALREDGLVSVETLRARWTAALDAAAAALHSSGRYLTPLELQEHTKHLAAEREPTTRLLEALAHDRHLSAGYAHLRTPAWEARRLLGLPSGIDACIFNADGVLIGSAALHAAAWGQTFDELLSTRVDPVRGEHAPFNPRTDYPASIHGRPRLEGIRTFLASRGIRLQEGDPGDAPGAETVHGLVNRKNELLRRLLDERGVTAFEGSRRYLELAREADIRCAVVSASANTGPMLERAGLTDLVDALVDGNVIVAERLHPRPAPDILLAACARLGVEPGHAAVFETSPGGVAAAAAGGFELVVGVDHAGQAQALAAAGADRVASGLAELLEPALAT